MIYIFEDILIWFVRLGSVLVAAYGYAVKSLHIFTLGVTMCGGVVLGWGITQALIGSSIEVRSYGLLGAFAGGLVIWASNAYLKWCYKNNRVVFTLVPVRKRDSIVKKPHEKEEEYRDRMR